MDLKLRGDKIALRALEPQDLDFLYEVENNEALWEVSNTIQPYSKYLLKKYLENAHQDIFEAKQLRLVMCKLPGDNPIGLIDLYDFDPLHHRAGIGIVIATDADRGHGYAKEAIELLKNYAFKHLDMHQLYAAISEDNKSSIRLFEALGFIKTGVRKQWLKVGEGFIDEYFYQLIHE